MKGDSAKKPSAADSQRIRRRTYSHKGYTSRAKKWIWLYKDLMLAMFSEKAGRAQNAYLEFVSQKNLKR